MYGYDYDHEPHYSDQDRFLDEVDRAYAAKKDQDAEDYFDRLAERADEARKREKGE